jgi:hypothetical protein
VSSKDAVRSLREDQVAGACLAQMHERRGDHYGPELREAGLELVQRRSDSSINATVL